MSTIKFNNAEFEVLSYNKSTYFGDDHITSNASCNLLVTDMSALQAVAQVPITSIQIYHDNDLIYDLQSINAHFDSINEYLNDDRMDTSVSLHF